VTGNDRNTQVGETSQLDPMALILQMRKEMELLKKKNEEEVQGMKRENEEELAALRRENARMKQKLNGEPTVQETIEGECPLTRNTHLRIEEAESSHQENTQPISMSTLGTVSCRSPFMESIMEVPLPSTWKNPTLDKYDRTTDPDEHVDAYIMQVSLYTAEDALLCRVFPTSLKGAALSWFTQLLAYSIDCFDTLVKKFGAQFATSNPHHFTFIALVNIRQEKTKSLRTFVERFGKVVLNIRNLSP